MFPCLSLTMTTPPPPPAEIIDDESKWEVDRILDHRVIKHKKTSKVEYLLCFLRYGPEHDVWQDDISSCPKIVKSIGTANLLLCDSWLLFAYRYYLNLFCAKMLAWTEHKQHAQ